MVKSWFDDLADEKKKFPIAKQREKVQKLLSEKELFPTSDYLLPGLNDDKLDEIIDSAHKIRVSFSELFLS